MGATAVSKTAPHSAPTTAAATPTSPRRASWLRPPLVSTAGSLPPLHPQQLELLSSASHPEARLSPCQSKTCWAPRALLVPYLFLCCDGDTRTNSAVWSWTGRAINYLIIYIKT